MSPDESGERTIDVGLLRPELDRMLARYGLPPEALLLVPSVQEWAQSKGLVEDDPWRLATAFPAIGGVVMMSPLLSDFMGSTSTFIHLGLDRYQWVIENDLRAVKHLLLHEIAHLRGIPDERGADEWAYNELQAMEDAKPG